MRALLVLALVAALAVAADRAVAVQLEQRAAAAAGSALGAPAEVDLRGFPIVWHLLRGRVPEAVLEARAVPVGERGGRLPLLRIELREVRVDLSALSGGRLPAAEAGAFHAEIGPEALAAIVGAPAELGRVEIAEGLVRFTAGAAIEFTPTARDGMLVLAPRVGDRLPEGATALTADLSGLPGGPAVDAVLARPGVLLIDGHLSRVGASP